MPELMAGLGTTSRHTVLRQLATLDYINSYSHRRGFYALRETADFDASGLWSHGPARFSRRGTLLNTVQALTTDSCDGRTPRELDAQLGVSTKAALRRLIQLGKLVRMRTDGRSLYCDPDPDRSRQQLRRRQAVSGTPAPAADSQDPAAQLATARARFLDVLDERTRRLYAGLQSLQFGRGGDRRVAQSLGLHPSTVRRGRLQLLSGDSLDPGRVRRPGGGRKTLEKKACNPEMPERVAPQRHRRRPDSRSSLVATQHRQALARSRRTRPSRLRAQRSPPAARDGVLPARQPQAHCS